MNFRLASRVIYYILLLQTIFLSSLAQNRKCETISLQKWINNSNPILKRRIEDIESLTQQSLNSQKGSSIVTPVIIIPVVVHVLYHNAVDNISDEQIKSQIDVLNEDYSAINSTIIDIPSVWQNFINDSKIRFQLAKQDPIGNFSDGITRTFTGNVEFAYNDTSIFFDAAGGKNAWPDSSYLNIWVCSLKDNVLGFAALPGTSQFRDGIVIINTAIGRVGHLKKPYNLGRTSTHEIGHWLSMRHIWGDDNGACNADPTQGDGIADTPDQGDSHFRCPGFPSLDNCSSVSPGVMYMNYMDYTDDKCMMFFTPDQTKKMYTTLNVARSSIKNSNGSIALNSISKELSIDSILSPVTLAANRCFIPIIRLANEGNTPISNIPIRYSINSGIEKIYICLDTIAPHSNLIIHLPTISGIFGENLFEARINIVDSNSVNNYSSSSFRVNSTSITNCENSGIQIFPNPLIGLNSINIQTKFSESQQTSLRLFNAIGQLIFEKKENINPGDMFTISLQGMSAGFYIFQFDGIVNTESAKFIYLPQ